MKHFIYSGAVALALMGCGGGGGQGPTPGPSRIDGPTGSNRIDGTVAAVALTLGQPQAGATVRSQLDDKQVPNPSAADMAVIQEVIRQTNALRQAQGLQPLRYDAKLSAYAQVRAKEIKTHFAHERPDGSSVGRFAENIAHGYDSAGQVMTGWQNSPGHYQNLVNPQLETIGVGYYIDENGHKYWTQLFGASWGDKSSYSFVNTSASPAAPSPASVQAALNGIYSADAAGLKLGKTVIQLANNQTVRLEEPSSQGWKQQTVGVIRDADGRALGYLNLGRIFTPAADSAFKATYRGQALGDWQGRDARAEVLAEVDFTGSEKNMALRLYNSQLGGQRQSALDFSDGLRWNGAAKRFEGAAGNFAQFYGPAAEELGGQFKRAIDSHSYQGAYGAVKQ